MPGSTQPGEELFSKTVAISIVIFSYYFLPEISFTFSPCLSCQRLYILQNPNSNALFSCTSSRCSPNKSRTAPGSLFYGISRDVWSPHGAVSSWGRQGSCTCLQSPWHPCPLVWNLSVTFHKRPHCPGFRKWPGEPARTELQEELGGVCAAEGVGAGGVVSHPEPQHLAASARCCSGGGPSGVAAFPPLGPRYPCHQKAEAVQSGQGQGGQRGSPQGGAPSALR